MKSLVALALLLLAVNVISTNAGAPAGPMKVAIVGMVHGHISGFLNKSALTPAGGILNRPDVELVGIVEPDQKLFDSYAARYHLSANLHFRNIQELVERTHPRVILVFTAPSIGASSKKAPLSGFT